MSVSQVIRNPRGYIVRTAGMYRALLFDPERFYDEYLGARGMKVELGLLAFIGLVGLLGNYYARTRITTVFGEAGVAIGNDVSFNLWGNTAEPIIGIILLWAGLTTAVFALSWLYTTVGNFYELMKHMAWALVPLVVFNVLNAAAVAFSAFQFTESDVADLDTIPRAPDQRTEVMWEAVTGEVYVVATIFVGALAVVWCAYIALHATIDVRQVTRRDAYKVVALPFAVVALYLLYDAVTTLTSSPL